MNITSKTIEMIKCNRLHYIVEDLGELGINERMANTILLIRGVYQKFCFWRDMMCARSRWRVEINRSLRRTEHAQNDRKLAWSQFNNANTEYDAAIAYSHHRNALNRLRWEAGFRAGLDLARTDLEAAAQQNRWIAPDNDDVAERWLQFAALDNLDTEVEDWN